MSCYTTRILGKFMRSSGFYVLLEFDKVVFRSAAVSRGSGSASFRSAQGNRLRSHTRTSELDGPTFTSDRRVKVLVSCWK